MENTNNEEPLTIKELNNAVKTQNKKQKKEPRTRHYPTMKSSSKQ